MNPEKILVDTSAWIVSFKKDSNPDLQEFLRHTITRGIAVTSQIIILELIQGCKTLTERDTLREKLETLEVKSLNRVSWEKAYELAFSLRRKGLNIPNTDLLIAAVSMVDNYMILHQDEHYDRKSQRAEDGKGGKAGEQNFRSSQLPTFSASQPQLPGLYGAKELAVPLSDIPSPPRAFQSMAISRSSC
ncbi:MAG: PIN domain-containing protein [Candidatus Tectomicrobia bacterium]|uniref:PIN domain-containing protein n=1 Tax=Tectimicrobiota bacterium TaxID=2528274 RepID=A0A933GMF2_UNCTE|nr:PIN domain-containing protein [Candidatus Tectomicrobia bacterium]